MRFYGDLARWWPLISPVEDYADEAAELARVLEGARRPVREVLELGAGGGHNAFHLKARFALTLTDLSPEMLERSRAINPQCAHAVGDMRTLRLGRTFDAVFVHDAIGYATTEAELAQVIATAAAHVRPGGVVLLVPDEIMETLELETEHGGADAPDGAAVRYLEWSHDPDPTDHQVTTEYVFVVRAPGGTVEVVHESHTTGVFPEATWRAALAAAGLEVEVVVEHTADDRTPRRMFLGHAPGAA
jgi:SAM-dependent methyltransferase